MSNVKGKIRKLLSIAKDRAASEHEIESCLRKAERLMYEHRLSEADLSEASEEDKDCSRDSHYLKKDILLSSRCYKWEGRLASYVQTFVGGVSWFLNKTDVSQPEDESDRYMATVVYFGLAADVEFAVELFGTLRRLIMEFAVARHRGCFRGPGASYAEGFVDGLERELGAQRWARKRKAEKANDGGKSLCQLAQLLEAIEMKEQMAEEWLASPDGGDIQLGRPRRIKGSTASEDAFYSGVTDGGNQTVPDSRIARLSFRA